METTIEKYSPTPGASGTIGWWGRLRGGVSLEEGTKAGTSDEIHVGVRENPETSSI